jgi:serine/threonine protein kinase
MAYAAARYTEAKLDSICQELFKDIDSDTVDIVDNYDATMKEPALLPTTFPNVLVSANQGIAVGMAYVHSTGIIHRDLNPRNVLLDANHLPRICDFGSRRLFGTETTMTAAPAFTPCYGAPELYMEEDYNEQVDVYSFGVMLYELATGTLAFRGLTQYQLVNRLLVQQRREAIPATVTPFARDLIERCWQQDTASRPSFSEICSLLAHKAHTLFPDIDLLRLYEFLSRLYQTNT